MEEEGWKEIKKGKVVSKPSEQTKSGTMGKPHSNTQNKPITKGDPPSVEKVNETENHEETEDHSNKLKETVEKSTVPLAAAEQRGTEGTEEHISLASDSGEESEERDTESDGSQITPIKSARGRKSKKKQREEKTYLDILQGSQKTLKGMMNTRSGRKQSRAPKGATTSQISK